MKNIVITGSTRGIGLSMTKEFLKSGCNVTISGRGETLPQSTKSELKPYTENYIYVSCNVQDYSSLQNLWDISQKRWGQIDIWINNAGQNTPNAFVYEMESKYVQSCITTNITGMIYGSQVAAQGMIKQRHGAIYSMEGLGSNNMIQPKTIIYGTTKHALTYFMKGLSRELEDTGVIAGRLSPGMMLTDFITKTPDGEVAAIQEDERFKRIFNILADKPETVAAFFIPKILTNNKNDAHIMWLTNTKAAVRFITAPIRKRKLI